MDNSTTAEWKDFFSRFYYDNSIFGWAKKFFIIFVLLFLISFFWQNNYFQVNRYEPKGVFVIKAANLYKSSDKVNDKNEYVFTARITQQDEKYISFEISAKSTENIEQIKVYKTLGKIVYNEKYVLSNSPADGYLYSQSEAKTKETVFVPTEIYFDSPKELKLGIKLKHNEHITIDSFDLIIPVDLKVLLTRQDGTQVFDAYGNPEYTSRMSDIKFRFVSQPISGKQ